MERGSTDGCIYRGLPVDVRSRTREDCHGVAFPVRIGDDTGLVANAGQRAGLGGKLDTARAQLERAARMQLGARARVERES